MEINNQEKTTFMNIENSTDNYAEKDNQIKKKKMSITYKLPRQKCQSINNKKKKKLAFARADN